MDDSVLQAMAKWPNVPECFGWLRLDGRGRWRVPSGFIEHPRMLDFIGRNYTHDSHGRWYFQNGPQRVYVDLEYTPRIYRIRAGLLQDHTGQPAGAIQAAYMDENGTLVLHTDQGLGALDDRDLMALPCDWDDTNHQGWLAWQGQQQPILPIQRAAVASLGNFVVQPR